jgi:hypothetical protein
MIISVEELKQFITTDKADSVLEVKLQALEQMIRKHTNNRFHQMPYVRIKADVIMGIFITDDVMPFKVGDTVQVSQGADATDCGIYTITEIDGQTFTVKEDVPDMAQVTVSKVAYGIDVKMGVINLMEWDLNNRHKVGVQSETLSRHSVTYFNMDGDNSLMGYPKSLLGFLKPYMKARF